MINNLEKSKIAIIGLGYVGLPLAIEFSKKYPVVGFDLDKKRISELKDGYDRTNEVSKTQLFNSTRLQLSFSNSSLKNSNIYIITVPTPVDSAKSPDLSSLLSATNLVSKYLTKGNIVIYESTVFPGCTDEVCIPILERESKLSYNNDFFCGYSPERINPGDKEHTLTKISKITSGGSPESAEFINNLYASIISAGTFMASSIAVAEAAKVIENTQRDVNIALINELSLIFDKLNLDTVEILEAASTKWNFLPFKPGLVGGHCIGVDPYYLTYRALEVGYEPEIILAGRRINDDIGSFIAEKTISEIKFQEINPVNANIAILGLTFKENCPDLRNTKVITIIDRLVENQCKVSVSDVWADALQAKNEFNIDLVKPEQIKNQDAIIIAVGHDDYKNFSKSDFNCMLKPNGVLIDVKSLYPLDTFAGLNIRHWRL